MATRELLQHEVRKVDTSGRLSLGRERVGTQYDVTEAEDGTITLLPVTVIPTREVWLHHNPEAKAAVISGLADSAAGRTRDGGDFTQYLDGPDED
jgi:hypothetical protein